VTTLDVALWPERRLVPYETSALPARRPLVLAPHPDDEVFGCGAAVAALNRSGAPVRVLVLSDGAGLEEDQALRAAIRERRMAESKEALLALGGGLLENAGLKDRGLTESQAEVVTAIAASLAAHDPDLVLAPSPVEVHPDHRAVAGALTHALRRARTEPAARVAFYELSQPFRPNLLLDASADWERKERAMAAFASQNEGRDYPGYVRGLSAYRRMTLPAHVLAVEAFHVVTVGELLRTSPLELESRLGPSLPRPRPPLWRRLIEALR
jgi:LmbE family N-acetylglucosaminyl deacetylase